MTRLRPRNVRTRLTLWYVGVLSGVLALYAGSTLTVLYVSLRQGLDRTLGAEYERIEDVLAETPDGTIRMGGHDEGEGLVEVWSPEGTLLFRNPEPDGETLGGPPTGTEGSAFASMVARSGTPLRVLTHAHHLGEREVVIRVAVSEEPVRHEWRELAAGLLAGLPVAVAIAGLGGHWLARRALAPIDRMARHAERLTADTLGERLPVENPEDELGHLARVFGEGHESLHVRAAERRERPHAFQAASLRRDAAVLDEHGPAKTWVVAAHQASVDRRAELDVLWRRRRLVPRLEGTGWHRRR